MRVAYGCDKESFNSNHVFSYATENNLTDPNFYISQDKYTSPASELPIEYDNKTERQEIDNKIYFNDFSGGIDTFVIATLNAILNNKDIDGNIILAAFIPKSRDKNELFTLKVIRNDQIYDDYTGIDYYKLPDRRNKYNKHNYEFVIETDKPITKSTIYNMIEMYIETVCSATAEVFK